MKNIFRKRRKKISEISDEETSDNLAKEVGFVQRSSSKMKGYDFVQLMASEILGEEAVSPEGLCDILRGINPKAVMKPQSLSERINGEKSVEYLSKVFEISLKATPEPLRRKISSDLLSPFGRVFLEDSTEISLNEKLNEEFRGSGGNATKSALKTDLIYEVTQEKIHNIEPCRIRAVRNSLRVIRRVTI